MSKAGPAPIAAPHKTAAVVKTDLWFTSSRGGAFGACGGLQRYDKPAWLRRSGSNPVIATEHAAERRRADRSPEFSAQARSRAELSQRKW